MSISSVASSHLQELAPGGGLYQVVPNQFLCVCMNGFADGQCDYDFIAEVAGHCNVTTGGACGMDVNECASRPCANGGGCSDSTTEGSIGAGYFLCACLPGFVGDTCATDVDECGSAPCANNATCIESIVDGSVAPDAFGEPPAQPKRLPCR